MFRTTVLAFGILSSSAYAHHAACVSDPFDGFMTCGAHSGRISFELQNFGDVTEETQQLILCNDRGASVTNLQFEWVESENEATHFSMEGVRHRQISENCALLGGLNFAAPDNFKDLGANAWRLDIFVDGIDIPTRIYVEAVTNNKN